MRGTVMCIMVLQVTALGVEQPSMTCVERETELFGKLNLDYPGLEPVRDAVQAGLNAKARDELVAYFRRRTNVRWHIDPAARPRPPVAGYNTARAERVLKRVFSYVGKEAQLPKEVNWDVNPVDDLEWTCGFNQHSDWVQLGLAFWNTHDQAYARDFDDLLRSWLAQYPRLDWRPDRRCAWRSTLRAAVRMMGAWPSAWWLFQEAEAFTAPTRLGMLHSIAQHGEYLASHPSGGNWLLAESTGLLTIGTLFPELKEADTWARVAAERLYRELDAQVYPDGVQIELTPHYHSACMNSFYSAVTVARLNEYPLPGDFLAKYERMFECLMKIGKPDNRIPMLNDSDHDSITGWMQRGYELFGREEFLFRATAGAQGRPPAATSFPMPYAGFRVTRSDWTADALYLCLDVGPYGLGHQHEDKLAIDVHAYGRSHILDPGRFTYAAKFGRAYFRDTQSHSTIMVDGYGQSRRGTERELWVTAHPLQSKWTSNAALDFAAGTYEDGYGPAIDVAHVRKVLFVKNDYWVVMDRLVPINGGSAEHEFQANFQFAETGATVDPVTKIARSHNADANLDIIPVIPNPLTTATAEGEENPLHGWIGWSYHRNHKTPATMVMYRWTAGAPSAFDALLLPYPGSKPPDLRITDSLCTPELTLLEVATAEGRDVIVVQHRDPGRVEFAGVTTDAEVALVRTTSSGGRVRSVATLRGGRAEESGRLTTELAAHPTGGKTTLTWEDAHTAVLHLHSPIPVRAWAEFGLSGGGGYVFATPMTEPPSRDCSVVLRGLTAGCRYTYRLWQATVDLADVAATGTFSATDRLAFDFDNGKAQGWSASGRSLPTRGGTGGGFSLRARGTARRDVAYIQASRAMRFTAKASLQIDFEYRASCPDAKHSYFKLQLSDSDGVWWSKYLDSPRTDGWQQVQLGLSDFRWDGPRGTDRDIAQLQGAAITRLTFTMRKGETAEAAEFAFDIDSVAVTP